MHRRRCLPLAVAVVLALTPYAGGAQASRADSANAVRIARLATLGRVWGEVKYFHPYLAYRAIDWDSAFFAAYPRVNAARTPAEFAAALQGMLDAVGDPLTRVLARATPAGDNGSTHPLARWLPDSTLVLRLSAVGDLQDFPGVTARLDSVGKLVDQAHAIILDFRGTQVAADPENDLDIATYFHFESGSGFFDGHFVTAPLLVPAQRARMYSGFPPQSGGTSGGYYAAFYAIDGAVIAPTPGATAHPIAVVVDEHSSIPDLVPALRSSGAVVIIASGAIPRSSGAAVHVSEFPDGLRIAIRTSESAEGAGPLVADSTLAPGDDDHGIQLSLALLGRTKSRAVVSGRSVAEAPPAASPPEALYASPAFPDSARRVLAAFRFWTAINYFYPYRHLIGEDWNSVLPVAIAALEGARDSAQYVRAVVSMVRHIHDSHGGVSSAVLRDLIGAGYSPAAVRIIEGRPVIIALLDSSARHSGLRVGDEILTVDGVDARQRLEHLQMRGASSTPQAEAEGRANMLLRGRLGDTVLLIVRGADGKRRTARLTRVAWSPELADASHAGAVFRMLAGNIGYADLSRLTVPQVDSMFDRFKDTRAIIFDMRGYPNGTAWAIAPRLADHPGKPAAIFRRPLRTSPDTTDRTTVEFSQLIPPTDKSRYTGRTVMLIDARAVSQAEHTGLFFEAANGTVFVGSPTNGANGDVTNVVLPGGITVYFSGHDVRHADGRQLQRLGLKPDVLVYPTIAGVRDGRDEVLEAAVRYLERSSQNPRQ